MLGGLGAAAVVTGSVLPVAIAMGAELLWVGLFSRLPSQGGYFRYRHQRALETAQRKNEQELLNRLTQEDRQRFLELDRLRQDIAGLVDGESNFSAEMIAEELPKLEQLVQGFLRVASTAARFQDFVAGTDLNDLEEQLRRQEAVVEKTTDQEAKTLARQNLELIERRLERAAEVRRQVSQARSQLNLIDNTVRLLRDQIATMQSPEELSHRLDDLVRTVDSIEATAKETQAITRHLDPALTQSA